MPNPEQEEIKNLSQRRNYTHTSHKHADLQDMEVSHYGKTD